MQWNVDLLSDPLSGLPSQDVLALAYLLALSLQNVLASTHSTMLLQYVLAPTHTFFRHCPGNTTYQNLLLFPPISLQHVLASTCYPTLPTRHCIYLPPTEDYDHTISVKEILSPIPCSRSWLGGLLLKFEGYRGYPLTELRHLFMLLPSSHCLVFQLVYKSSSSMSIITLQHQHVPTPVFYHDFHTLSTKRRRKITYLDSPISSRPAL